MARHVTFARRGTYEGVDVINIYRQAPNGKRRKVAILSPQEMYALTEQGVDIAEQIQKEQEQ